jgi:hypothetical protein
VGGVCVARRGQRSRSNNCAGGAATGAPSAWFAVPQILRGLSRHCRNTTDSRAKLTHCLSAPVLCAAELIDVLSLRRLGFGARLMNRFRLDEGAGSFIFADHAAGPRRSIRVFYYRPQLSHSDTPLVMAMHGIDRAAADFRDCLVGSAERLGLLVLVPEFDTESFPSADSYNYGNVRSSDGSVVSHDLWNFGIIDRLFQKIRDVTEAKRETFSLFGLSAGGQYVLRYLALTKAPHVDVAVSSNSGWYMLPDLGVDYPVGMGGVDVDATYLRRYLERRLIVLLGDADTDEAARDLPRSEAAVAQGPHRLARGLWYFNHCKALADRLGVNFGWRLETVHGAGHVDQTIFDLAANLTSGRETNCMIASNKPNLQ